MRRDRGRETMSAGIATGTGRLATGHRPSSAQQHQEWELGSLRMGSRSGRHGPVDLGRLLEGVRVDDDEEEEKGEIGPGGNDRFNGVNGKAKVGQDRIASGGGGGVVRPPY
jgi:hypothetical protein